MDIFRDFAYAILKFSDGSYFIPGTRDTALSDEFDSLEGEYFSEGPFGAGWKFTNAEYMEDLRVFLKEQTIPYIFADHIDMELHSYL